MNRGGGGQPKNLLNTDAKKDYLKPWWRRKNQDPGTQYLFEKSIIFMRRIFNIFF